MRASILFSIRASSNAFWVSRAPEAMPQVAMPMWILGTGASRNSSRRFSASLRMALNFTSMFLWLSGLSSFFFSLSSISSCNLIRKISPSTLLGAIWPCTVSSIMATGARAQQPTQATRSILNSLSGVVWPSGISSLRSKFSRMISPALTWHAVPRQTLMGCLPGGWNRNWL